MVRRQIVCESDNNACQDDTRVERWYCTAYYWPGKRSQLKIRSTVSTECVLLSHHHKVEVSLIRTTVN